MGDGSQLPVKVLVNSDETRNGYDPQQARDDVKTNLLSLLPER